MDAYQPLQNKVYLQLKEMIFQGKLKPHVIYSETKMSQELNTSRTPFKIALARLSQESYVDIIPSKGFQLHIFTEQDVSDICQQRAAADLYGALKALSSKGTPEHTQAVAQLKELLDQMQGCMERGEKEPFSELDTRFHKHMAELSGNSAMYKIYTESITPRIQLIITSSHFLPDDAHFVQIHAEHMAIWEAIRDGDMEKCYHALMHHAGTFQKTVVDQYRTMQPEA